MRHRIDMTRVQAYVAAALRKPLGSITIDCREPGPHDVGIAILFCGVRHPDVD